MEYCCHFPCGSVDWNRIRIKKVCDITVTSLAEVWIEIVSMNNASGKLAVTSLAEVWIEIANCAATSSAVIVTSLAEVWIEIMRTEVLWLTRRVTSLAEVWIEMIPWSQTLYCIQSLPLRKCGLKYCCIHIQLAILTVTSLAEVWIEIRIQHLLLIRCESHFPCGSVDWNCHTVGSGSDGVPSLPLRKCGLKYVYVCPKAIQQMSLPLRKCGLK